MSQNNPVFRSESKRIFDSFTLEVNSVVEDDVSAYEDEVKQSLNRKRSYPRDNEKTPKFKKDHRTPKSQDKKIKKKP